MKGGRISRGWTLTKVSWEVVKRRPALLVLPVVSLITTAVAGMVLLGPWAFDVVDQHSKLRIFVAAAVCSYPFVLISTFFNVAFYAMANAAFDGREMGIGEALAVARKHLRSIAVWSLVSTLVGTALRALEQAPGGGALALRIAEVLLSAAWALASYFVVPALAIEDLNVRDAMRRSISVIRERWGESVTGNFVIGVIMTLVLIPVVIVGAIGIAIAGSTPVLGYVIIALAVVVGGAALLVQTAVAQVFRLAVFRFATTGEAAAPFTNEQLESAFRQRRNRFR